MGSGAIFLDGVVCNGRESHLLRCHHGGLGQAPPSCQHHMDIAIVCCELRGREGGRGVTCHMTCHMMGHMRVSIAIVCCECGGREGGSETADRDKTWLLT